MSSIASTLLTRPRCPLGELIAPFGPNGSWSEQDFRRIHAIAQENVATAQAHLASLEASTEQEIGAAYAEELARIRSINIDRQNGRDAHCRALRSAIQRLTAWVPPEALGKDVRSEREHALSVLTHRLAAAAEHETPTLVGIIADPYEWHAQRVAAARRLVQSRVEHCERMATERAHSRAWIETMNASLDPADQFWPDGVKPVEPPSEVTP